MPNPVIVFDTSLGSFEVELYQEKAPITVKNFLDYVNEGFYDGTIFHRVIDNFMVQGGGFTPDGKQKSTKAQIKNESGNGVKNCNYGIAMARTNDLNSATCQFYINVKDNTFLDDNKYCAFGLVTSGRETIDKIKKVKTGQHSGHGDWPVTNVTINSAKVKA
ncbi:MAG: peptidyl-prolyl cis-trans isomerase [Planctomycetes bacterium]|nr:peptidyl-prolyl cis-trans isomerase [Planctomycetota bacterium]